MLSRSRNLFSVRQVEQCGDLPKHEHTARQSILLDRHQVQTVEQFLKLCPVL